MKTTRLNNRLLLRAVRHLEAKDHYLKFVVSRYGAPPLWEREEGFKTLIKIILEQQVSLASAKSAYEKLLKYTVLLTPDNFLKLSDEELKSAGFSRQKALYGRNLAGAIIDGSLVLTKLPDLDDAEVKEHLMKIKGVGSWTSDIYLLMALGRPDVWPSGDLALASAIQKLKGMVSRPSNEELNAISLEWRPWRAVAARILWHYYLSDQPKRR